MEFLAFKKVFELTFNLNFNTQLIHKGVYGRMGSVVLVSPSFLWRRGVVVSGVRQ